MRKLNQRKIRWVVRELERGKLSAYRIAKQQGISKAYAWRLFHKFRGVEHPKLLACGRRPKPFDAQEVLLVKRKFAEMGFGAVNLEKLLAAEGVVIPHNRIHAIMKHEGLARTQPNKSRRRKWIRYERRHSNSLWHADWFEVNGRQYIVYEDDASRLITGVGEFANATTENALTVFNEAVQKWGAPKQVMTDHGCQFCANEEREFVYQQHLKTKGVKHIMARVKHPQSNGKVERLVYTLKRLMKWKGSLNECVDFYNEKRPHMSLENDCLRTPFQAYQEKRRGET